MGEVLHETHGACYCLRRALYLGEAGVLEELRVEQRPQHGGQVVVGLEVGVFQHLDGFGVAGRRFLPGGNLRLVGDEEVVQVAGDEAGRRRLPGNDVYDLFAVEVAALAEEGLLVLVVVGGVVDELGGVASIGVARDGIGDGPAGESAGRFLNVIFRVVGMAVPSRRPWRTAPAVRGPSSR